MKVNDIKILIGTSGWMYNHWKGPFYPEKFSNKDMLKFYTNYFLTVEVNNTFYKLPKVETVQKWMNKTPEQFIFAIKANQFITHRKYLKDGQETVKNLLSRIKVLDHKLGAILFQLPPNWHINFERIKQFIETLPSNYRYVFEMRHPSWYNQDIYNLLKEYNIALCIHDFAGKKSPVKITTNFVYIRFHGPEGYYFGKYKSEQLNRWAERIYKWTKQNITVFAYFNNDAYGRAVENALEIKNMINKYLQK